MSHELHIKPKQEWQILRILGVKKKQIFSKHICPKQYISKCKTTSGTIHCKCHLLQQKEESYQYL
jgi:hypothetical protein